MFLIVVREGGGRMKNSALLLFLALAECIFLKLICAVITVIQQVSLCAQRRSDVGT